MTGVTNSIVDDERQFITAELQNSERGRGWLGWPSRQTDSPLARFNLELIHRNLTAGIQEAIPVGTE